MHFCIYVTQACNAMCHLCETYSTYFAHWAESWLRVIYAQLARIVHMMNILNNLQAVVKEANHFIGKWTPVFKYIADYIYVKGYECTKIFIDILLRRLKGLRRYKAGAALKRKMTFPLFNTIKVWEKKRDIYKMHIFLGILYTIIVYTHKKVWHMATSNN